MINLQSAHKVNFKILPPHIHHVPPQFSMTLYIVIAKVAEIKYQGELAVTGSCQVSNRVKLYEELE